MADSRDKQLAHRKRKRQGAAAARTKRKDSEKEAAGRQKAMEARERAALIARSIRAGRRQALSELETEGAAAPEESRQFLELPRMDELSYNLEKLKGELKGYLPVPAVERDRLEMERRTSEPGMTLEQPGVVDERLDALSIGEDEIQREIQAEQAGISSVPDPTPMTGGGGGTGSLPPAFAETGGLVDPTPGATKALGQAYRSGRGAMSELATADEALEKQRVAFDRDVLDIQADKAAQRKTDAETMATQEALRQTSMEKARGEITRATAMVMDATIDPKRLFPTTTSKMGAALAVGLGQFGATLTGTQNAALQIIDSAIERDIAAQRAEIDKLKFGVQVKQNEYGLLMDEIQDKRSVESVIRQLAYQRFDDQLAQVETKFNINSSDARVSKLRASVKARLAEFAQGHVGLKYQMDWQSYAHNSEIALREKVATAKAGLAEFSPKIQEKLMGARMAKRMIAGLKELAPETNPLGGLVPWHNLSEQYQEQLKGLGAQIVRTYSGVTATEDERKQVAQRLGGYFNTAETKVKRLGQVEKEIDTMMAASMDVMTASEQALFIQRFGDVRATAGGSIDFITQLTDGLGIKPGDHIQGIVGPAE